MLPVCVASANIKAGDALPQGVVVGLSPGLSVCQIFCGIRLATSHIKLESNCECMLRWPTAIGTAFNAEYRSLIPREGMIFFSPSFFLCLTNFYSFFKYGQQNYLL